MQQNDRGRIRGGMRGIGELETVAGGGPVRAIIVSELFPGTSTTLPSMALLWKRASSSPRVVRGGISASAVKKGRSARKAARPTAEVTFMRSADFCRMVM